MASSNGHSPDIGNEIVLISSKKTSFGEKDFEKLYRLGSGAIGNVSLVRKRGGNDHGKTFAYKEMTKANVSKKAKRIEYARTERQILEEVLGCNFLVQLHYAFQTYYKLVLVMDFANGGTLAEHLSREGSFDEPVVRFWTAEITLALEYLHEMDVVYRDLKPENTLLDFQGHIVLTDFGLSKKFKGPNDTKRTYSYCGTPEYMSPEVVTQQGHSYETDFWSLGVLAYELLTGYTPFGRGDCSAQEVTRRIINHNIGYPEYFSDNAKDFVQKLLWFTPSWRLGSGGFEDIKYHPFFKTIDWERLENKEIIPPFKPDIHHQLDLCNFDQKVVDSPFGKSKHTPPVIGSHMFEDFDYVAPWVFQEENEEESKAPFDNIHNAVTVGVNKDSQTGGVSVTEEVYKMETLLEDETSCNGVFKSDAPHNEGAENYDFQNVLMADDGGVLMTVGVYDRETLLEDETSDVSKFGVPLNGGTVDLLNVYMADDDASTEYTSAGLDNGTQHYSKEIFFVQDLEYDGCTINVITHENMDCYEMCDAEIYFDGSEVEVK